MLASLYLCKSVLVTSNRGCFLGEEVQRAQRKAQAHRRADFDEPHILDGELTIADRNHIAIVAARICPHRDSSLERDLAIALMIGAFDAGGIVAEKSGDAADRR